MRGETLSDLLSAYRAEARLSLNPAHNIQQRPQQVALLSQKQRWFWADFAWPHLRVERIIPCQAGGRFYAMPLDIDIDRINHIQIRYAGVWRALRPGIDAKHYAAFDSDSGVMSSPAARWQITEGEELEIWPVPDVAFDPVTGDGGIKVTGIRKLSPLADDSDTSDLDGALIVLSCAADYLASTGAADAQLKIDQANRYYFKLRSGLLPRRVTRLFGRGDGDRIERIPVAIYGKP